MTSPDLKHLTRRALFVTALPVEYAAVRKYLTSLAEEEHPQGDIYEQGIFQAGGQQWQVGIVEMGMGNPNAAQKTERAIAHFQPEAVFFVGVAGGIKDAGIGDVVVANKVYDYHFGKAAEEFKTRPEVGLPGHRLLERARAESRKSDWMQRLLKPPEAAPKVFLGAIAAGEQVVTSTQSVSYQLIRNSYNDALALEMESYGFLKAAQAHPGLEALAVRGISDLLEGKAKADEGGSQELASRHAAAFAFEVLAKLKLPEKVRIEIREVMREVPANSPAPIRSNLPTQHELRDVVEVVLRNIFDGTNDAQKQILYGEIIPNKDGETGEADIEFEIAFKFEDNKLVVISQSSPTAPNLSKVKFKIPVRLPKRRGGFLSHVIEYYLIKKKKNQEKSLSDESSSPSLQSQPPPDESSKKTEAPKK